MKNKKVKLLLIFLTVLVVVALYFLFHKKEKIILIGLNHEKLVPSDVSLLVRFDDLSSVWSNFKRTNFFVHFQDFSKWFLREMPSETLGFTNDIKDIQKNIGFELDEKNILAFLGKKILMAMWLENPDDRKILLISELGDKFSFFGKVKNLLAKKTGIDEYKGITIDIFGENRYWCLVNNMLIISNDTGTIRKIIDFSVDVPNNSIADDAGFKTAIKKIDSSNYIYIKPQKINLEKYNLVKNGINTLMVSVKFKNGITSESHIFQEQPSISFYPDERKNLQTKLDNLKHLIIHRKSNKFSIDLYEILTRMSGKNYFKFLKPADGYFTLEKYGSKTVIYLPMTDLPSSEWSKIFSDIRKIIYKKIFFEKEELTRKNLVYLRESLNIYNSKTGRYPNKLDSLIDEYLNEIPQELLTKSNSVVKVHNGHGGWFYKNGKVKLNVFGTDSAGNFYTQW